MKLYLSKILFCLTLVCAAAGANSISGQTFSGGKIEGRVADANGAFVAGAKVFLTDAATKTERTVTTNEAGEFTFAPVRNGDYVLRVEAGGFQTAEQNLTLESDNLTKSVSVKLNVGAVGATVEVQAVPERTTASRTDIALRDLPVTINSVGEREIRERGADELVSALRYTNNVYSRVNFGVYEHFVIRGFSDIIQMTDGVRNEDRRFNTLINNVESVEVLKGPAGALYGGTTIGGVINVNRKKPSLDNNYEIMLGAGGFGTRKAAFASSGKLGTEKLLHRFDFGIFDAETYRNAPVRSILLAPTVYWQITPRDRLNFNYQFNRDRFATDAGIPVINNQIPRVRSDIRYNAPQDRAIATDNNLQIFYNRSFGDRVEARNVVNFRDFRDDYLSAETLQGIAPRTVRRFQFYFDRFRQTVQNQSDVSVKFNTGAVAHKFLAGYDFQRFRQRENRAQGFTGAGAASRIADIDLFDPVETQAARPVIINATRFIRSLVNAFFVQDHVTYKNFKAVGTLRYDDWRRRIRTDNITPANGAVTTGATVVFEAKELTGRFGAVYQFAPQFAVYASFGNSFTPVTQISTNGRILEPERGRQFEIGTRFDLWQRKINLTTAAFQINRENVVIPIGAGNFEQAGEQRSRGFEADLEVAPVERVRILANYGYTDSSFLRFQQLVGGAPRNLAGRVPAFVPKHTASVWGTYDFPNGLGFGAGGRFVGKAFTSFFNDIPLDEYFVADAAVFYRKSRYDFTVNLQNVGNKKNYYVGSVYNTQVYPGKPFDLQAAFRVRF